MYRRTGSDTCTTGQEVTRVPQDRTAGWLGDTGEVWTWGLPHHPGRFSVSLTGYTLKS